VITVLVAGRPLYTNDLMNLSDSFVAAWLPGTEGKGVADVLFKGAHNFKGTLSFSWPKAICQATLNAGDANYAPLFALGYGLDYASKVSVGQLDTSYAAGGCGVTNSYPVFNQADRATWPLYISSFGERKAVGTDVNAVISMPAVKVETAQVNTQQDAKLVTFSGAARLEAHGAKAVTLPAFATVDGALQFDTVVSAAPNGKVMVAIGNTALDLSGVFQRLAGKPKQTVRIPLACFVAKGADLAKVDTPFAVSSDAAFAAAFANIQIVGGAAREKDALTCGEAK
jgi:beta-glucosidase